MNQEKIGKFIQEKRKEKGITQKEFAEQLGVTDKTVSRWENGHYLPDVSLFSELCKILDIDVIELLNGEKLNGNRNRTDIDQTIMKIVNISDGEIKKNKKKTIIISIAIISFIIILFGSILLLSRGKNNEIKYKPGDFVPYPSQTALREKEDGWVCHFDIEYLNDSMKMPYYYGYNCENFKYGELYDFMPVGKESDENGIFEYKTSTNHPNYIYHKEYGSELRTIDEYFKKNQFNTPITISDLDGLNLNYISKEEVLELYNEAISSPKIVKWGKNIVLQHTSYMNTSMTRNDYTWKVGYFMSWGQIKYVNIELMINDKYLSDLIRDNEANEEQKEIYKNIEEIKKYIMEEQKFELPKSLSDKRPYTFLKENFDDISNLEK